MPENNLPQQQPQYIYVQPPRYNEPEELEIDLVELFKAIWKKKWFVFFIMCIFAAGSVAYALHLPNIYKAESRIMPQGGGGRASALAAQYGGLASMMGISLPEGAGGAGAVMVEILKGNSVVDEIIKKFNLMEEYKQEYVLQARKAVLKNFDAEFDSKGSGIITVSYLHEDPQRAADIVNAFVDELKRKMQDIAISDSKQKREFYENQLMQAQIELEEAEQAMIKYQQASGVIVLDQQARALLSSIATLRAQIASKNVEISSLKSYLKSDNPRLKLAQSQLEGMQRELKRLEEEQKRNDTSSRSRVSGDLSVGELPERSIEYQHYVRDLRVATAKYEMMRNSYESARLGEVNEISTISVIDPAMPPDFKDRPGRARICMIGTFLGFFLSAGWISMKYIFKESQKMKTRKKRDEEDYEDDDED